MLDVSWSPPYIVREGFVTKWRREWCIPQAMLSGFFAFWKPNRFKMLAEGFTVIKSENSGKWYLYETKDNSALFKIFGSSPIKVTPEDNFVLPTYTIKDTSVLRPWQIDAAGRLCSALNHWGSAIDGSETGVGKSFNSMGAMRDLNVPFVIISPKPVITPWKKVIADYFSTIHHNFKGIINYELLIRGKKDSPIASFVLHRHSKRPTFEWKIPKNTIIIWDEAHRLKNFKTKSSKACQMANKQGYKQLFLSATLATSPLDLRTVGICTKLFKSKDYFKWACEHGVYKGQWGMEFNNDKNALRRIHKYLFEQRGVRLQRDMIPNFPETEIIVNSYDIDEKDASEIRMVYDEMHKELETLTHKEKSDESEMAIRIRALQRAEIIKIPLIEDMVKEGIDDGMSVVVFLNYSDSIDALASRLGTTCIYDGRNEKTRQKNIELFQSNKESVIIANIAAAREGINLGDELGGHPRLSLFSPPYSVTKLKQALGRIHRENSKSKSIQKIIYVAGTQEDRVVKLMGTKLENLTMINNGEITDDDLKI